MGHYCVTHWLKLLWQKRIRSKQGACLNMSKPKVFHVPKPKKNQRRVLPIRFINSVVEEVCFNRWWCLTQINNRSLIWWKCNRFPNRIRDSDTFWRSLTRFPNTHGLSLLKRRQSKMSLRHLLISSNRLMDVNLKTCRPTQEKNFTIKSFRI